MMGEQEIKSQEQDAKVIEVPACGSFVFKSVLRQKLNISTKGLFHEEIAILEETVSGFSELYEAQKRKKKVSIEVARIILITIFSRSGDEVTIKFKYEEV